MTDEQNEGAVDDVVVDEKTTEFSASEPEAQGFDKAFDIDAITVENRNIQAVIEGFSNDFAKALGGFWGKKFEVTFTTLKYIESKDILNHDPSVLYANYSLLNHHHHGLIHFQRSLLNAGVDYLFGSEELSEDTEGTRFGGCALKVARKIADLCLLAIQNAVEVFTEFQGTLLECSDKPKSVIRSRHVPEKACQFSFEISGVASTFLLSYIIPESVMEHITFQPHAQTQQPSGSQDSPEGVSVDSGQGNLKGELSDVSVELVAVLPEVKLNLSSVMNLKKGDLIPIGDPQQVELKVGDRRAYKAVVGQSNALRVVKITERLG